MRFDLDIGVNNFRFNLADYPTAQLIISAAIAAGLIWWAFGDYIKEWLGPKAENDSHIEGTDF